ncbi:HesA/MoeB/ThiF family protein [Psychrobacter sp. I-STPA10]|uniref:HesA/MoeB/ThiF family protein n=1 Tax=Psychrobacter sp. I-STPA10 TaxID=2585769 RepID=UPI001E3493AB|nr:HesA/MoeB/ThiF family protein [Psychrobacter sp. I-STPA10]
MANDKMRLTDAELLRYSRQILLEGWDIDAQIRLKNSQVVILGAGGLGCPVSETLARAGVGHIHIIDDDVIELSNLQRQTLFTAYDVGQPKAKVAQQRLAQINELISVSYDIARINRDNAKILLHLSETCCPDLILDCSDNFATRDLLNRLSVSHHVPLLSASAIAMTGQLALYEPQKQTGCYHCVFGSTTDTTDAEVGTQNCTNSGVLASTTAVMASLQANAALQYLGLTRNPLTSQLLLWDGKRMSQRLIRYQQDKACPICS